MVRTAHPRRDPGAQLADGPGVATVRPSPVGRSRQGPRLWALGVLAIVIAWSATLGTVADLAQYRISQLTAPYAWSALAWEADHLPRGLELIVAQARGELPPEAAEAHLRAYVSGDLVPGEPANPPLDLAVAAATQQELLERGFARAGPIAFPPVSLAFVDPPQSLVVSPRNEIRVSQWALVRGDLGVETVEDLERAVEQLDLSALVVPIGGIATYPTLIPPNTPPFLVFQTVAHEWTHIALFFTPLGRAYGTSVEARNINETTADFVGTEVAGGIASRLGIPPPRQASTGASEFREALRRIRLGAEERLAQGDVEGAEAYMEAERQKLVARGYHIRRLNQAYFAFYGNYAEGPVRSTEIPDALTAVRTRSASLGDFLARVGQVTTVEQLRALAAESVDAR